MTGAITPREAKRRGMAIRTLADAGIADRRGLSGDTPCAFALGAPEAWRPLRTADGYMLGSLAGVREEMRRDAEAPLPLPGGWKGAERK